jgi:hypothetical protein
VGGHQVTHERRGQGAAACITTLGVSQAANFRLESFDTSSLLLTARVRRADGDGLGNQRIRSLLPESHHVHISMAILGHSLGCE